MENKNGSITVFLTFIFLVLFALFMTMLETCRLRVCSLHGYRTLETGARSLLTEYSSSLYDNYKLLFIEDTGDPFEQVIGNYCNDTLNPGEGDYLDLLGGTLSKVDVTHKTFVGDKRAEALQEEIYEYMIRKLPINALDEFLKKTGSFGDVDESATQLSEDVAGEEQAAQVDLDMMKLMKIVDGVSVDKGKVSCEDSFVKLVIAGDKNAANAGIYEGAVWDAMKDEVSVIGKYCGDVDGNKSKLISLIDTMSTCCNEALAEGKKIKKNLDSIVNRPDDLADYYSKMESFFAKENFHNVLNANISVLAQVKSILQSEDASDRGDEIKALWKQYDTTTISFDYHGVTNQGGDDNPREEFGKAWGSGILSLVLEKPKDCSGKSVDSPKNHEKLYDEEEDTSSDYEESVDEFAQDETVDFGGILGDTLDYGMNEFCLDSYISEMTGAFDVENKALKHALEYENEYIIFGNDSDEANLGAMANRLLLLRLMVNLGTIYSSSAMRDGAYGIALGIVGFTGMEPLIRLTQTIILVTLAFLESFIDVSALFLGEKVPVIKTRKQLQVGLTDVFSFNHKFILNKAKKMKNTTGIAMDYKQYRTIFMVCMNNGTKRYRLMDLIQWNMRKNGRKDFVFSRCVYQITVEGIFSFQNPWFQMPLVAKNLNRRINQFYPKTQVTISY